MAKKEKPIIAGQQDPSRCITFPKNDTFFIVRSSVLNVIKSLNFGEKNEDFKSYGCAAALVQYFMNIHNNTLDWIKDKPSDFVPSLTDFETDCSKSYLTDVLLNEWVANTVIKARDILALNDIIKIRVHSTQTGRITKGRFIPDTMQRLINQYGAAPRAKVINDHTKVINDLSTKGINDHTKGNNDHTKGINDHTKGNNDHISNYKESIKESIKEVCTDTPQKNQNLNLNQFAKSSQNNPKLQIEKKPIVNLVNYNSAEAFLNEFSDYLMDNRKSIKEGVKEFEFSKISSYSEKYTSIVFGGKYEGLKSYQTYSNHCEKMIGMGIVNEVNACKLPKNGNLRGEGQLSIDMKNGTLERSVEANLKLWKNEHDLDLDLEGF